MNPEKLEKLKKLQDQVRIGGKGSARRKKKVVHTNTSNDDRKLQPSLRKLMVSTIPQTEEVNMFKDDGTIMHFKNPKAQASLGTNTFVITGSPEMRTVDQLLPGIIHQMGSSKIDVLKRVATICSHNPFVGLRGLAGMTLDECDEEANDEIPDLVSNFEAIAMADEKETEADKDA